MLGPLFIILISALLIVTPSVSVWRSFYRQARVKLTWRNLLLSLFAPSIAIFTLVALIWLPTYSGQCGGWLGETTPCSSFTQFAYETFYWAAMSLALPGLTGIIIGLLQVFVGLIYFKKK
jgi:hypothetical protein